MNKENLKATAWELTAWVIIISFVALVVVNAFFE